MQLRPLFTRRLTLVYILLWVIVAVAHSSVLFSFYGIPLLPSLAEGFLFNLSFALIGVGLWYMVRFSDLQQRSWQELVFLHLSAVTVVQLLWIMPVYSLLQYLFRHEVVYLDFLGSTLTIRVITGIVIYLAIVSIAYLMINIRQLRDQQLRQAEL